MHVFPASLLSFKGIHSLDILALWLNGYCINDNLFFSNAHVLTCVVLVSVNFSLEPGGGGFQGRPVTAQEGRTSAFSKCLQWMLPYLKMWVADDKSISTRSKTTQPQLILGGDNGHFPREEQHSFPTQWSGRQMRTDLGPPWVPVHTKIHF